jgi:hypothetical protein
MPAQMPVKEAVRQRHEGLRPLEAAQRAEYESARLTDGEKIIVSSILSGSLCVFWTACVNSRNPQKSESQKDGETPLTPRPAEFDMSRSFVVYLFEEKNDENSPNVEKELFAAKGADCPAAGIIFLHARRGAWPLRGSLCRLLRPQWRHIREDNSFVRAGSFRRMPRRVRLGFKGRNSFVKSWDKRCGRAPWLR